MNNIIPITRISTFEELARTGQIQNNEDSSLFGSIFQNAIDDVVAAEENVAHKEYLLATGQLEDGHTLSIATAQAQLSIDMLIQLRNHTVEAYNELLRMNI